MNKHPKMKQFVELEINDTYKDAPSSSKHEDSLPNETDQSNNSIHIYEQESKFEFNVVPIKVVALTAFLFVLGTVFLITGIVFFFRNPNKYQQYISLILVGGLMLIPGVYYTGLLIKFTRADSRQTQQKILNELPID